MPKFGNVLLGTVIVVTRESFGCEHKIRALIDSGSEINLISKRCLHRLCLSHHPQKVPINGINSMSTVTCQGSTNLEI